MWVLVVKQVPLAVFSSVIPTGVLQCLLFSKVILTNKQK